MSNPFARVVDVPVNANHTKSMRLLPTNVTRQIPLGLPGIAFVTYQMTDLNTGEIVTDWMTGVSTFGFPGAPSQSTPALLFGLCHARFESEIINNGRGQPISLQIASAKTKQRFGQPIGDYTLVEAWVRQRYVVHGDQAIQSESILRYRIQPTNRSVSYTYDNDQYIETPIAFTTPGFALRSVEQDFLRRREAIIDQLRG